MDGMDGLLDFAKTPQGQGLLAAVAGGMTGAQRGTPWNNAGRAGLAGLAGYSNAVNMQGTQELRDLQTQKIKREQDEFTRKAAAQNSFGATVKPEDRPLFEYAPDEYIKNLPQFQKQQLVEVADPEDQLRTVKQWMRPGETQGPVAGYGTLPEILDPRIRAAKEAIARAGASKTSVNVSTGKGDEEYAKKRLGGEAGRVVDLSKSAENAYKQIQSIDRFVQASANGAAGSAQPMITAVQGFLSSFGYDSESLKDTRMMEQAIGDILGSKMAELGARGLTDQDMKILREALPRVATDRGSRESIAGVLKRSHKATLEEYDGMRAEESRIYPELATRIPEPVWYRSYKGQRDATQAKEAPPVRRYNPQTGRIE